MKLVVIGGVAAGMSAASKAIRINKDIKVEVYTDENYVSYAGCGLPYYVEGLIPEENQLVARTKEQFNKQGIEVFMNNRAVSINPGEKSIKVIDENKNEKTVAYDKLVIATGARAVIPSFLEKKYNNVFTVTTIPSSDQIRSRLESGKIRKAVIVGGGYIGLEMVEAIKAYDVEITLIQRPNQLLRNMDKDMAGMVEEYLRQQGIDIRVGENVFAVTGEEAVEKVITDKEEIPTDLVIMAIGVQPNSELAEACGIELGPKKAIKVNNFMETNIPDIYAAGDCASAYHIIMKDDTYIPLGTTANKQGKTAGENAAGGRVEFAGIVGTTIIKVMDLEIGRTGLSVQDAEKMNKKVVDVKIKANTRAHYYPGASPITVKLLLDKESQKIIGGQIVGGSGAGKRIDVLAAAVQLGLTPYQLSELDLSYAPPFSPVWDPVLVAANVAISKLEKSK